mgnify:CR=1 FL=1
MRPSRSATSSPGSRVWVTSTSLAPANIRCASGFDPNKTAAWDLTAQDVVQALQEQNVQVAAGIIGAPPVPKDATAFQYTVSTQGRLTTEEQFRDIVVKTGTNGRITRVRDIARVELAARDYTVSSQLGESQRPPSPSTSFQVRMRSLLRRRCAKRWRSWKQRFPPGLDYTIVYDPTVSVRESIHEVQKHSSKRSLSWFS